MLWKRQKNRIKKICSMLLVLSLCLCPVTRASADGELKLGAVTFRQPQKGQLVVSGYDAFANTEGNLRLAHAYQAGDVSYQLRGIDSEVFRDADLTDIYVETKHNIIIGSRAFQNIVVQAVSPAEADVIFAGGAVTAIGKSAFEGAWIGGNFIIDEINGTIGEGAFRNITVGGNLKLYGSIDTIGNYAFAGMSVKYIYMPKTVAHIGDGAFQGVNIPAWNLGDTLETMGSGVFDGCEKLTEITLSASSRVTSVAKDAFPDKEGLTIIVPKELADISVYRFENYKNLVFQVDETLTEENSVIQYLRENRLAYKKGKNGEIIRPDEPVDENPTTPPTESPDPGENDEPTNTPDVSPSANPTEVPVEVPTEAPVEVPTTAPTAVSSEKPVMTPSMEPTREPAVTPATTSKSVKRTVTIKQIKYKVRKDNKVTVVGTEKKNWKKITIPNTVTIRGRLYKVVNIEKRAFYKQKKLVRAVVGDYVETIGEKAFAGCVNLTSIQFGAGLKSMNKKVLYQDRKLKKILFKGTKLKAIGKKTFFGVPKKVDIRAKKEKIKEYAKLIRKS